MEHSSLHVRWSSIWWSSNGRLRQTIVKDILQGVVPWKYVWWRFQVLPGLHYPEMQCAQRFQGAYNESETCWFTWGKCFSNLIYFFVMTFVKFLCSLDTVDIKYQGVFCLQVHLIPLSLLLLTFPSRLSVCTPTQTLHTKQRRQWTH